MPFERPYDKFNVRCLTNRWSVCTGTWNVPLLVHESFFTVQNRQYHLERLLQIIQSINKSITSLSSQDEQENVDNIQIEIERRKDVLLWADRVLMISSDHQLRIVD